MVEVIRRPACIRQQPIEVSYARQKATPAFALPGSLKILIAEDSADNRLLVQAYLRGSPHGLTFVEDGEAAVKEFTEGRYFDLILMDMQMPRMDGLTATRAIREIERQRGLVPIPIIALTANARAEDAKMSEEAGCTAHLSKPISKHRLICALEEHRQAFRPEKRSLEPITVVVPDDLEELVPGYLEQRRFEVAGMMSLLAASDYERLRTLGHDMKGTGSSYGFLELTKLGGELESAAKRTDYKALALQIPQLSDYLSRVRLVTG